MQSILKKILPILLFGILIELFASSLALFKANNDLFDSHYVIAAETPIDSKGITPESSTTLNLKMSEGQDYIEQKWLLLTGILRWDIAEILVGTFLSIIGLAAITLALFRWKPKDLSLISFGIFCFLYGARTSAFQFFFDAAPWFWDYWKSSSQM